MPLPTPRMGPRPALDAMRREIEKTDYRRIRVEPLAPTIGAEIGGVDLSALDDETFAEIRRAFLDYKVVFFRDQSIDAEQQTAFAARFGEIDEHPFLPAADGNPQVVRFQKSKDVVGVENQWHSDVTWKERPPLATLLRAIEVPGVGGDTLFADMSAAWACLDDETREATLPLRAVHDFTHSFGLMLSQEDLAQKQKEFPPVSHPVVRTHPETGKKSLFVNAIFTSHIEGLSEEDSNALLRKLCDQTTYPEYQCRFRWKPGSVALWDNRAAQHYASNDYWPRPRVMERITIIGDRPS